MKWFLAAAQICAASAAVAQQAAPAAKQTTAPAQSFYCVSAAAGFLTSEAQGFTALRQCSRGDTIVIPSGSTMVVARICDFNKSIIFAGGSIVCQIVVPERPKR